MAIIIIMPIIDKRNPVIAKPLGALNNPIKENKRPRNQMTKSTTGTHERIIPKRANKCSCNLPDNRTKVK